MVLTEETLIGVIESISKKLIDSEKILTELDSPIGDADCGVGIKRIWVLITNCQVILLIR